MIRIRLALPVALLLAGSATAATETISYGYDVHGRLVKVARTGGPNDGLTAGYSFDLADNRQSLTVSDATVPSFSVADTWAAEGGDLVFTVRKSGTTSGVTGISYSTSDRTATAGSDYTGKAGTLSFAASEASKTVRVTTVDDELPDDGEKLSLALSGPTGGALVADPQAIGTIHDEAPNRPPRTVADAASLIRCAAEGIFNVTGNDNDPEGNNPIVLVDVTAATRGTASAYSSTSIRFVPFGIPGTAQITYTVRDSLGARSSGTLTVTLTDHQTCQEDSLL